MLWRGFPRLGAAVVAASLSLVTSAAVAQPKGKAPAGKKTEKKAEKKAETKASEKAERPAKPKGKKGDPNLPEVVEVEEGKEGVKTYKFGPVEVEGRMKSPQVIYFLRRVRAEFSAGDLGHRSFMRELSDTRRHRAFR